MRSSQIRKLASLVLLASTCAFAQATNISVAPTDIANIAMNWGFINQQLAISPPINLGVGASINPSAQLAGYLQAFVGLLSKTAVPVVNAQAVGAFGNVATFNDGTMLLGSSNLISASAPFKASDVGKTVNVNGAAATGGPLAGLITAFNTASNVTLSVSAGTGVSNASYIYGTLDTTAIQNAASRLTDGGYLYLPRGSYFIANDSINLLSNTTLYGDGMGATILYEAPTAADPSNILFVTGQNITIRDLTIDGNAYGSDTFGLFLSQCNRCTVERVEVRNTTNTGIEMQDSIQSVIKDCYVHNWGQLRNAAIGFGVNLFRGDYNDLVIHNRIIGSTYYGDVGLELQAGEQPTANVNSQYNALVYNRIEAPLQYGISVEDVDDNLIGWNDVAYMPATSVAGIALFASHFRHSPGRNHIVGNHLHDWDAGTAGDGIALAGGHDNDISDNRLQNLKGAIGITVTGANVFAGPGTFAGISLRNKVVRNNVDTTTGVGIFLDTGDFNEISDNIVQNITGADAISITDDLTGTSIADAGEANVTNLTIDRNTVEYVNNSGKYGININALNNSATIGRIHGDGNRIKDISIGGSGYAIQLTESGAQTLGPVSFYNTEVIDDQGGSASIANGVHTFNAGVGGTFNVDVLNLATAGLTGVDFANQTGNVVMISNLELGGPTDNGNVVGQFTFNPGNISNGSSALSSAQTVRGAALGMPCRVGASYDMQGLDATCYVSSANNVKVVVNNNTGGAVNLGSGIWTVRVKFK